MESRRDPLAAAAEIILEVERLGREQVDVASVGFLGVRPNRIGVIAADTQLTADIRDWDEKAIETAIAVLKTAAEASCRRRSVALSARVVTRATTTRFPEEIIAAVVAAAATVGHAAVRLPSAANHDASNLAAICPAGMVFVPSRGGRSHSPEEFTTPDACVVGTTVLGLTAHSLMTAAQSSEPSASEPGP
jgi:N-carbamoyl-L-amino-acid hydrolase